MRSLAPRFWKHAKLAVNDVQVYAITNSKLNAEVEEHKRARAWKQSVPNLLLSSGDKPKLREKIDTIAKTWGVRDLLLMFMMHFLIYLRVDTVNMSGGLQVISTGAGIVRFLSEDYNIAVCSIVDHRYCYKQQQDPITLIFRRNVPTSTMRNE